MRKKNPNKTISKRIRAGLYLFCYKGEWSVIMYCGRGMWQACNKDGGFGNAYGYSWCKTMAMDEIDKRPSPESSKYGWWKEDEMFKDLIDD